MKQISYFSTHTCLGGACIGAKAAGLIPLGGIEIDPYPVSLYRKNFGDGIRHESILDTPIHDLPDFDFLWSSPSCKSFSTANINGKELDLDISIAKKVAEIIAKKSPRYFALENVRGYLYKPKGKDVSLIEYEEQDLMADGELSLATLTDDAISKTPREFTESFKLIYCQLESMGYNIHFNIYDAADYGVPQNRNRLILRASRDPLRLLQSTHCKAGNLFYPQWKGWYQAIADLLPTCKRSHLTERQIAALEKKGFNINLQSALVEGLKNTSRAAICREDREPSQTICSSSVRPADLARAVLVDGKGNQYGSSYTAINSEAPSFTVTANMDRNISRAILLNGSLGSETNPGSAIGEENPSFTITSNDNMLSSRAVIIERTGYGDRDPIIRSIDEPCQTIRSSVGCDERGGYRSPITALLEQADVRALDYRCLARLQTIPDWYEFGDKAGQNCRALGNAVPSLFAQRVIESIIPCGGKNVG